MGVHYYLYCFGTKISTSVRLCITVMAAVTLMCYNHHFMNLIAYLRSQCRSKEERTTYEEITSVVVQYFSPSTWTGYDSKRAGTNTLCSLNKLVYAPTP